VNFKRSYITHYIGKYNKEDGSLPNRTVRDAEKLKSYLEMSCNNKVKSPIFNVRAKSVLHSATLFVQSHKL